MKDCTISLIDTMLAKSPALTGERQNLIDATERICRCFAEGHHLYICGNGGSAADCEHMAGELLKCFKIKRPMTDEFKAVLRAYGEDGEVLDSARFDEVARLEAMTPDERYAFWQAELSKCIRCNACRDICPACTCEKCVFGNPASGVENKAISDSFEEKMFHIIRAFHVAGRCTDCGECSRVCPQNIPLHLLNRKFIKDINSFYGEYQAGTEVGSRAPLVNYTTEDLEPGEVFEKGE